MINFKKKSNFLQQELFNYLVVFFFWKKNPQKTTFSSFESSLNSNNV